MKIYRIHLGALVDLNAKRGGWPSYSSLAGRCGRTQPEKWTNRRNRATCKACLKVKV